MIQVKIDLIAVKLYKAQEQMYNKQKLKVMTKEIKIEYMYRNGFIVGPNIQLADTKKYIKEINKNINIDEGILEIRKNFMYEKDV